MKFLKNNVIIMLVALMMLGGCSHVSATSRVCPAPLWIPEHIDDYIAMNAGVWYIAHTNQQLDLEACH